MVFSWACVRKMISWFGVVFVSNFKYKYDLICWCRVIMVDWGTYLLGDTYTNAVKWTGLYAICLGLLTTVADNLRSAYLSLDRERNWETVWNAFFCFLFRGQMRFIREKLSHLIRVRRLAKLIWCPEFIYTESIYAKTRHHL